MVVLCLCCYFSIDAIGIALICIGFGESGEKPDWKIIKTRAFIVRTKQPTVDTMNIFILLAIANNILDAYTLALIDRAKFYFPTLYNLIILYIINFIHRFGFLGSCLTMPAQMGSSAICTNDIYVTFRNLPCVTHFVRRSSSSSSSTGQCDDIFNFSLCTSKCVCKRVVHVFPQIERNVISEHSA